MEYFTGKDYPKLCDVCRASISSVAGYCSELSDEYASDEEGPLMYVYDWGLMCGGHFCKEADYL